MANSLGYAQDTKGNLFELFDDGTKVAITPGVTAFVDATGTRIPVKVTSAAPAAPAPAAPVKEKDYSAEMAAAAAAEADAKKALAKADAMYSKATTPKKTYAPGETVFTPVKEIVDRYGDVVRVDAQGRDEFGNIVFAGTDQSKVGGSPNTSVGAPAVSGGAAAGGGAGGGGEVAQDNTARQSAYDLLYEKFARLGLGGLVAPLESLIKKGDLQPSQFTGELRKTDDYKKRFAANAARQAKGLMPLDEATYIANENQYEKVMKNYGLPASYYAGYTDPKTGVTYKPALEKFLSGDVSPTELEDRIMTAQQRVLNTNPEVLKALKQFYPDISNADILAYTLDPEKSLNEIQRKVTAAEIGGAALAQGLQTGTSSAEALAGYGITKQQAQKGYEAIAEILPRGSQLASIYGQSPYTQQTAETEVFGTTGSAEAAAKRKKLSDLEQASFAGQSGVGALGRDRAAYQSQTYGAGQY